MTLGHTPMRIGCSVVGPAGATDQVDLARHLSCQPCPAHAGRADHAPPTGPGPPGRRPCVGRPGAQPATPTPRADPRGFQPQFAGWRQQPTAQARSSNRPPDPTHGRAPVRFWTGHSPPGRVSESGQPDHPLPARCRRKATEMGEHSTNLFAGSTTPQDGLAAAVSPQIRIRQILSEVAADSDGPMKVSRTKFFLSDTGSTDRVNRQQASAAKRVRSKSGGEPEA